MSSTPWIKAKASDDSGSCIYQRANDGMIEIFDSEDPTGHVFRVRPAVFAAWLDGARGGEFDHLLSD